MGQPPAARDFGIVFQSYALFPNLTIEKNIGYGLTGKGWSREARLADFAMSVVTLKEMEFGILHAALAGAIILPVCLWMMLRVGFSTSAIHEARARNEQAALSIALVTVATLGFGDILPADPVLRVVAPVQALVGFVLLTAAISWVLQVYPPLGRRRALARRQSAMR